MSVIETTDRLVASGNRPAIDTHVASQAGTLCLRSAGPSGEAEILLVASKRTGLWGIPKGHVEDGETPLETAAREAFEEGGVVGEVLADPIGSYVYSKDEAHRLYEVRVFLMMGARQAADYPESGLRRFQWVNLQAASEQLWHPALRKIVEQQTSLRQL